MLERKDESFVSRVFFLKKAYQQYTLLGIGSILVSWSLSTSKTYTLVYTSIDIFVDRHHIQNSKCHRKQQYVVSHTENKGEAHFVTHGLHVGNGVGSPWDAHGILAMLISPPTTSIYGNSGQLSRQPAYSNFEKVGSRVDRGVGCPWAAYLNFAIQIRLPTTSIYTTQKKFRIS